MPQQRPAAIAACESDVRSVELAATSYDAQKGSLPVPPAAWSAGTYVSNYAPLTTAADGPYLHAPPTTTSYVVEYDSAGNVWVAPSGRFEQSFDPTLGLDTNPNACELAVFG